MTRRHRNCERRLPTRRCGCLEAGPRGEESPDDGRMTSGARHDQRRLAACIAGVDGRTALRGEQELHACQMPVPRGVDQRRCAARRRILRVHMCAAALQ